MDLRDIPMASGVYCITNTKTGKHYVGSSRNMRKRLERHRWELHRGSHHSAKLQNAWNKYGPSVWYVLVLEECESTQLKEREEYFISEKQAYRFGYNMTPTAVFSMTPEGLEKLKRHWKDPKNRIAMSNRLRGKSISAEVKQRRVENASEFQQVLKRAHNAPEARANHSKAAREWQSDPVRAKNKLEACARPESKAKHSASLKTMHAEQEFKKSFSASQKERRAREHAALSEEEIRQRRLARRARKTEYQRKFRAEIKME